jgi:hypothetical protein
MNTANSESDINNYLHKGQADYISYNSIYNEVLDKVKKGLEGQRSSSSILKKNSKKNTSKNDENIHPEDIALFQDDDSDDSESDDFLEWENSDNESVYNSRFRGGLTRAKSHINDINDFNNTNKSTDNNLDIVKDRIVLNKHFQKIYGFNDSSFRHGDYDMYNNHDEDDSDNESINESNNKYEENENRMGEEETPITENTTEEEPPMTTVTEEMTMNTTENNSSNDDLEKQFYNELRKASMIIDLQQHYRIRDGVKNKEDLKQEIVEGYNSLHNKNYSSEDLPDFQNIDNLEEVEAKIIDYNINSTEPANTMNSTLSLLDDINEATKNNNDDVEENNEEEKENNQLINDTWKFLFNNPYSLQFLSKSLKSSHEKLSYHDAIKNEDTKTTSITESVITEKTEEDNSKTEPEASTSGDSKFELNNSLISNILQHNQKNEKKLMKDREEEELLRKNKENDWLSFVQKELATMNLSSNTSSHNKKETDKGKKVDYSKFIPNQISTAPKFEFTIQQDETK